MLQSQHAIARFHERWGEDRRVELLRSLRSGDGGAYRAVARTSRIAIVVNDVRLEFAQATSRLLTANRGRLRERAETCPLPATLGRVLQDGIRAAAAGASPGFGDKHGPPLDNGVAAAALSVLATGRPAAWCMMHKMVAVTTSASLVLSDVCLTLPPADVSLTRPLSLITLLTCDASQKFAEWKRKHAAYLKKRRR